MTGITLVLARVKGKYYMVEVTVRASVSARVKVNVYCTYTSILCDRDNLSVTKGSGMNIIW